MVIGETLYAAVDGPPDQEYELPPLAVRLVDAPAQILVAPEIVIVGTELTVTNCDALDVHPFDIPVTV